MVFDALGLIVAPLVAVGYGKIHWSYLLLSIAYYVFQGFLNIRRKRGLTIYPLHSSMLRRALAGFQMGFVALVLCPIFSAQVTVLSGFAFMLPVLAGFVVDWLVMTGRIKPSFNKLIRVSNLFLLPALRVILVFCAYLLAADSVLISSTQNTNSFFIYGIFSGAILVLFGLGGRIGALLVLLLISWHQVNNPLSILEVLFIWTSAWVLLLGTGSFNLWRGDHAWVNRHDGV
jgi:CDP-diacylglycerol--glycerol-3-phosphate 3-phosphatidyltransferase